MFENMRFDGGAGSQFKAGMAMEEDPWCIIVGKSPDKTMMSLKQGDRYVIVDSKERLVGLLHQMSLSGATMLGDVPPANPPVMYRIAEEGFCILRLSDIAPFSVIRPASEPDFPDLFEAEWYCENSKCPVREVRIKYNFQGTELSYRPVNIACPDCGKHMKFHHYIAHLTAIRVKE